MKRREVLGHLVGAAATAGVAMPAWAQEYPARPIKIIVPYAPGGSPDTVVRILSQPLAAVLGQPVVVENIAGSSGVAAIEQLKRSAPDGYTLIDCDAGHWAVNLFTKKQLSYNFEKDLAPVSILSTSALFLTVHESFPATNLQEMVAAVKAKLLQLWLFRHWQPASPDHGGLQGGPGSGHLARPLQGDGPVGAGPGGGAGLDGCRSIQFRRAIRQDGSGARAGGQYA